MDFINSCLLTFQPENEGETFISHAQLAKELTYCKTASTIETITNKKHKISLASKRLSHKIKSSIHTESTTFQSHRFSIITDDFQCHLLNECIDKNKERVKNEKKPKNEMSNLKESNKMISFDVLTSLTLSNKIKKEVSEGTKLEKKKNDEKLMSRNSSNVFPEVKESETAFLFEKVHKKEGSKIFGNEIEQEKRRIMSLKEMQCKLSESFDSCVMSDEDEYSIVEIN